LSSQVTCMMALLRFVAPRHDQAKYRPFRHIDASTAATSVSSDGVEVPKAHLTQV
jgi:hypothetical protein